MAEGTGGIKLGREAKIESASFFQKRLLADFEKGKSSEPRTRRVECALCKDHKWIDVAITFDEQIIEDQDLIWLLRAQDPLKIARSYCKRCPKCALRYEKERVHEFGRRRDSEYVDMKLIQKYWSKKKDKGAYTDPVQFAKEPPTGSILLHGETGRFKTLILEYWFNRKLDAENGDVSCMHWIHENHLVQMFQSDAGLSLIEELKSRKVKHFFYDEFLYPVNWRSREKAGHYSDMVARGFMSLFNYACDNKREFSIYASSNQVPHDVLKEPEVEPLLRRIVETFGAGAGIVKV